MVWKGGPQVTILMTGATGYLGSHVIAKLADPSIEFVVLKRSFSNTSRIPKNISYCTFYDLDKQKLSEIFDRHRFDLILHCATNYGRNETDPLQTVEANLLLPLQLLELGRRHGVNVFVNTDTILDKGVNTYSLSKSQFREWLKEYSKDFICCNVALEHFYGPGDDKSKFVSYVINSFLDRAASIPLTPGYQKRDFIYIDDVVDALALIVGHGVRLEKGFYHYEIGTGSGVTIREFVELIQALTGNQTTEVKFGAVPYRQNEIMDCHTDISRIKALGWAIKNTLVQGLSRTIQKEKELRGV